MKNRQKRRISHSVRVGAALSTAAALLLAGCGLQSGGGSSDSGGGGESARPGSIERIEKLDGVKLVVGSKDFTEQLILGQMSIAILEAVGAEPVDKTQMTGTDQVRKALESGNIDTYWEYVGTAWEQHLQKDEKISSVDEMYDRVTAEDEKNGIVWLKPSPLINSYSLALSKENADRLGITKMSELQSLDPSELTFCVGTEFYGRANDGYRPMLEHYDIKPGSVPSSQVNSMKDGLVYGEVADGTDCNFASTFTTDGRIAANELVVLEDDEAFWPPYNVAVNINSDTFEKYPELADVFEPVSDELTTEQMQELTAQKDVEGKHERDVARDWLKEKGFIE